MKISPARQAVFILLSKFEKKDFHVNEEIENISTGLKLAQNDKSLFVQIVYGVLRNKKLIESIISQYSFIPISKIQSDVKICLLMAVYQILFLERVPIYAILNDAVNLTKKHISQKSANFTNAILRKISSEDNLNKIKDYISNLENISIKYSHPEWLIESFSLRLNEKELSEALNFNNSIAPLTLRVNNLLVSQDELIEQIKREHQTLTIEKCNFSPFGINIIPPISPNELTFFIEGKCIAQDEASQVAALLVNPNENESILDYCSAPGGKITLIAQCVPNNKHLYATDLSEERLKAVKENCNKLKIHNIIITTKEELKYLINTNKIPLFDKIVVDAPCSGFGTIRRHPEIRWRTNRELVNHLHKKQLMILNEVSPFLKKGGSIFYSTCTLTKEENEDVIYDFLKNNNNFCLADFDNEKLKFHIKDLNLLITKEKFFISIPHRHNMDGFFCARLVMYK